SRSDRCRPGGCEEGVTMRTGSATTFRAMASHALAVAVVAAVTLACLHRGQVWGERTALPLFFTVIVITAVVGGAAPTLIVATLSAASLAYFFLPPYGPAVEHPADQLHLVLFVTVGVLAAVVSSHVRSSHRAMQSRFRTVFEHHLAPLVIGATD